MIIDAIRYAMGRRSYQVGVTCEWLMSNWLNIDPSTQMIIKNDIDREFKIGHETGKWQHLGTVFDIANWDSVRALWDDGDTYSSWRRNAGVEQEI